jgi:hypothetical protein
MAINVNTVYQTVLLILNKEQRGYITPVEFNKIGTQSQLEIFETYFESLNQQLRVPQTDTDYADRVVNLDEKISIFKKFDTAVPIFVNGVATSAFTLPGFGVSNNTNYTQPITSATQSFTANPAVQVFTLTGNALILSNSGGIYQVFKNGVLLNSTEFTLSGATLTIIPTVVLNDSIVINLYASEFYRLGGLFYTDGALPTQELERVTRSELYHLLSSNLTKPTKTYPIYVYEDNVVTIAPDTVTSGIMTSYIRKPIAPIWNFTTGANNSYTYQAVTSYDFELHPADQTELILKILLYSGVVIKSPEIVQAAAAQVQQENINQQR